MSDSNNNTSGGVGLMGLVFVVFLVLKLTETGVVSTWSWWWVTAPLWGGVGLLLAVGLAVLVVGFLAQCVLGPIVDAVNRRARLKRFDQDS